MENWLYGENVVVWRKTGWRPDILEFLNNLSHPASIRMADHADDIPMGALVVYRNASVTEIEEIKAYGSRWHRGWRFYPQDQLDNLARYLMSNPQTATPPPEPNLNIIAAPKPDDTYGDW